MSAPIGVPLNAAPQNPRYKLIGKYVTRIASAKNVAAAKTMSIASVIERDYSTMPLNSVLHAAESVSVGAEFAHSTGLLSRCNTLLSVVPHMWTFLGKPAPSQPTDYQQTFNVLKAESTDMEFKLIARYWLLSTLKLAEAIAARYIEIVQLMMLSAMCVLEAQPESKSGVQHSIINTVIIYSSNLLQTSDDDPLDPDVRGAIGAKFASVFADLLLKMDTDGLDLNAGSMLTRAFTKAPPGFRIEDGAKHLRWFRDVLVNNPPANVLVAWQKLLPLSSGVARRVIEPWLKGGLFCGAIVPLSERIEPTAPPADTPANTRAVENYEKLTAFFANRVQETLAQQDPADLAIIAAAITNLQMDEPIENMEEVDRIISARVGMPTVKMVELLSGVADDFYDSQFFSNLTLEFVGGGVDGDTKKEKTQEELEREITRLEETLMDARAVLREYETDMDLHDDEERTMPRYRDFKNLLKLQYSKSKKDFVAPANWDEVVPNYLDDIFTVDKIPKLKVYLRRILELEHELKDVMTELSGDNIAKLYTRRKQIKEQLHKSEERTREALQLFNEMSREMFGVDTTHPRIAAFIGWYERTGAELQSLQGMEAFERSVRTQGIVVRWDSNKPAEFLSAARGYVNSKKSVTRYEKILDNHYITLQAARNYWTRVLFFGGGAAIIIAMFVTHLIMYPDVYFAAAKVVVETATLTPEQAEAAAKLAAEALAKAKEIADAAEAAFNALPWYQRAAGYASSATTTVASKVAEKTVVFGSAAASVAKDYAFRKLENRGIISPSLQRLLPWNFVATFLANDFDSVQFAITYYILATNYMYNFTTLCYGMCSFAGNVIADTRVDQDYEGSVERNYEILKSRGLEAFYSMGMSTAQFMATIQANQAFAWQTIVSAGELIGRAIVTKNPGAVFAAGANLAKLTRPARQDILEWANARREPLTTKDFIEDLAEEELKKKRNREEAAVLVWQEQSNILALPPAQEEGQQPLGNKPKRILPPKDKEEMSEVKKPPSGASF